MGINERGIREMKKSKRLTVSFHSLYNGKDYVFKKRRRTMKAILMSIKPEWVAKILNGEKTIEIRKKFPKDYVGWVYIYCTKGKPLFVCKDSKGIVVKLHDSKKNVLEQLCANGKVVARFWCDKVEEIICRPICGEWESYTKTLGYSEITKASCLENREIVHYLKGKNGYAIHITKLEIFDKPKELKEFYVYSHSVAGVGLDGKDKTFEILKPLAKAPQSYCFIRDVL